jgi:hypothetical protein
VWGRGTYSVGSVRNSLNHWTSEDLAVDRRIISDWTIKKQCDDVDWIYVAKDKG